MTCKLCDKKFKTPEDADRLGQVYKFGNVGIFLCKNCASDIGAVLEYRGLQLRKHIRSLKKSIV